MSCGLFLPVRPPWVSLSTCEFILPSSACLFCSSKSLSLSLSFLDLAADGAGRGGAGAATPLCQLRCGAPASQCRGRVPVRTAPQPVHCPCTLRQQPHMCGHTHIQSQTHCTTVCTQTQTVTRSSSWVLPWSHGHGVTVSHPCSEPPVHTQAWIRWLTCSHGGQAAPYRTTRLTDTEQTEL